MLKIAFGFVAAAVALAYFAPQLLLTAQPGAPPPAPARDSVDAAEVPAPARGDGAGEKSIAADPRGQYGLDVLIGGQTVHMLVDTGASMVVISAEVADRLGLSVEAGRKWRVHTANGDAIATEAILPSVDLGTIYMKDVQALIAARGAGTLNLLGASFLRRLSSVEQRNGVLILRQ